MVHNIITNYNTHLNSVHMFPDRDHDIFDLDMHIAVHIQHSQHIRVDTTVAFQSFPFDRRIQQHHLLPDIMHSIHMVTDYMDLSACPKRQLVDMQ